MQLKHVIFRTAVALATGTTLVAGPSSSLQAAGLDPALRSSSASSISVPRLLDALPSSSVQPNPGAPSAQSVGTSTVGAPLPGSPAPSSPRQIDQASPVTGRSVVVTADGKAAAADSLLVTF